MRQRAIYAVYLDGEVDRAFAAQHMADEYVAKKLAWGVVGSPAVSVKIISLFDAECAVTASGFGERLKEFRRMSGLSQEKLAAMAQCDIMTISRLERGERRMSEKWIKRLSTALGVSPSDMVGA